MLGLIVFISGAVVMMLELVGSRIVAPYLGTSIFVWTSLIGIILGSLSCGYFIGGRLADKNPSYKILSYIILVAAILVGLVAIFKSLVLSFLFNWIIDIRLGAIAASLILFAPTSLVLGMVSPYAIRLKLQDLDHSGATVGSLYAISTVGSIVGTFLAGFVLIAYLGNTKILYLLALTLIITSVLAWSGGWRKTKALFGLLLLFALAASQITDRVNRTNGFVDVDTNYNRIWIFPAVDPRSQRPILTLMTDPHGQQSAMFFDQTDELVFDYTKYYDLAFHFKPDLNKALMLGGAGYSYPKYYLKNYPQAELEVVEIDPKVTELARRYFNLPESHRLTIYHEDARTFINRSRGSYGAIMIDAFTSHLSIPFQLTTREAIAQLYRLLDDDGLVLINVISALEGERGRFLSAFSASLRAIFPQVYIFPVTNQQNSNIVQNIMLVALKSDQQPNFLSDDPRLNSYLEHRWSKESDDNLPILTDDYAPVEIYALNLL